ncbi:MAG: cysteine desulfurase NifS [Peptococcaceae bacterium]|jgi:cysteine desulfurase|nr:cysteine desulfurase NifS [Peptococcaceae bacterium]MDH7525621.1 cysteine desulfurase NifS [Peptococcaceae bacterium]
MRKVYLDHGATTPVREEVARVVAEYMTQNYGNASSIHAFGREARAAVEKARRQVAGLLNARAEEIVFTGGGTEANNLAITGAVLANSGKGRHIITSAVEHHAVLDTCRNLQRQGYDLTVLPVDGYGLVNVEDLKKAITPATILISIMHANNEVGTIEPLEEIGHLAREHGIIFHTDAVQSFGKLPIDVEKMNIDLLAGSGHKIYAPKGIGFLYVRKGVRIAPLHFGGGQEGGLRPGTENVAGIAGLGLAAELAGREMEKEAERQARLRDLLVRGLTERIPHVRLNGHPELRLASNAHFSFEFVEGESLLISLDMKGIAASSGSACTSGSLEPSHVLVAMGIRPELARGAVRMTLGRDTTEEDINYVLEIFPEVVKRLRAMSPLYPGGKKECGECAWQN